MGVGHWHWAVGSRQWALGIVGISPWNPPSEYRWSPRIGRGASASGAIGGSGTGRMPMPAPEGDGSHLVRVRVRVGVGIRVGVRVGVGVGVGDGVRVRARSAHREVSAEVSSAICENPLSSKTGPAVARPTAAAAGSAATA